MKRMERPPMGHVCPKSPPRICVEPEDAYIGCFPPGTTARPHRRNGSSISLTITSWLFRLHFRLLTTGQEPTWALFDSGWSLTASSA
jgi:hypothetical protein